MKSIPEAYFLEYDLATMFNDYNIYKINETNFIVFIQIELHDFFEFIWHTGIIN